MIKLTSPNAVADDPLAHRNKEVKAPLSQISSRVARLCDSTIPRIGIVPAR